MQTSLHGPSTTIRIGAICMNENHDALAQVAHEEFAYLTTTGRRSGQEHRIEIWFGVHDGRIYLMSGGRDRSDWVKNLQADPRMKIEIAGETHRGVAAILTEPSEADQMARMILMQKYGKDRDLEKWGRESLAIAIDLVG